MLISPSEPKELKVLATVSAECEDRGADMLIWYPPSGGYMGIQRKEFGDLISSLADGRFAEQLAKMSTEVNQPVVIIEGDGVWGSDGQYLGRGQGMLWTSYQALLLSVRAAGVWVVETKRMTGVGSTYAWLEMVAGWVSKHGHDSLSNTRGPVEKSWGKATNRNYQKHLLLGLPGMGPKLADRVLDHVGMPLTWRADVEDMLIEVEGVGQKKIDAWREAVA